jgi:hypothetical protein
MVSRLLQQCLSILRLTNTPYSNAGSAALLQLETEAPLQKVEVYLTGDLAFQAMALGKESMSGWWCMQCKGLRLQFLDDCELWTMEELVIRGMEAETKKEIHSLG